MHGNTLNFKVHCFLANGGYNGSNEKSSVCRISLFLNGKYVTLSLFQRSF